MKDISYHEYAGDGQTEKGTWFSTAFQFEAIHGKHLAGTTAHLFIVFCPECGGACSVNTAGKYHSISEDGTISPELHCGSCGWTDTVKLLEKP